MMAFSRCGLTCGRRSAGDPEGVKMTHDRYRFVLTRT